MNSSLSNLQIEISLNYICEECFSQFLGKSQKYYFLNLITVKRFELNS